MSSIVNTGTSAMTLGDKEIGDLAIGQVSAFTVAPATPASISADIVDRVKKLIPTRWFSWTAPIRDAILGGIADGAAWCYSLIGYARQQSRIRTASGPWLDIAAFDFLQRNVLRSDGQNDPAFRTRVLAELLRERVTRAGMTGVITELTGKPPIVFEPWNTGDTGAYGVPGSNIAYGFAGGWGNLALPSQVFMKVHRPGLQGIPNVGGYGAGALAYGTASASEWTNPNQITGIVTDADIYAAITRAKPTGCIVWTQLD